MVGRLWQSTMIAMARSGRIKRFMQTARATSFLRDRYVAGVSARDGVARAAALMAEDGLRSSLFYMGEYVDDPDLVAETLAQKKAVAEALGRAALDVHISVDPTQIGYQLDPGLVEGNARAIAAAITAAGGAPDGVHGLMFDMEDATLNDPTIAVHNRLQDAGYPVALTLQAYLHRTQADLAAQIARGSRVRLVKGAFAAGPELALQSQADIKDNFRTLIRSMLSPTAKAAGFYPIVATHDTTLHDFALAEARAKGWQPGTYEFEMLLGVRGDVARALAQRGERVRLYVPFGRDWWPHAVRRIGETPRNAVLLARSLIG